MAKGLLDIPVLNNLFIHPYVKVESVQNDFRLSRLTAAIHLEQLTEKGFIENTRSGVTTSYVNRPLINIYPWTRRFCRYPLITQFTLNAIIPLGCGWTTKQVSDALLIDEGTLRTFVKRYRKGGVDKLLQVHYSGGLSYLTVVQ